MSQLCWANHAMPLRYDLQLRTSSMMPISCTVNHVTRTGQYSDESEEEWDDEPPPKATPMHRLIASHLNIDRPISHELV